MSLNASLRSAFHREPVVMWSLVIAGAGAWMGVGASTRAVSGCSVCVLHCLVVQWCTSTMCSPTGLAIAVVVPPIREGLGYKTEVSQPAVRKVCTVMVWAWRGGRH